MVSSLSRRLFGLFTFLTLAPLQPTFAAATPVDPTGLWFTKNDASIIKISPCGSNYCGKLAWMKEPKESDGSPKVDHNNKDTSKRTRPMVGLDLLIDMSADEDHWKGKAYNPEDGKTYDVTFKVGEGKSGKSAADTAEIEGCMLKYLCKSETFKRATEIPKTQALH